MKFSFIITLLLLSLVAFGQVSHHGPPCGGMDILQLGIHIKGISTSDHYCDIRADSLRKGFSIALKDSSYKITQFLIVYSDSTGVQEFLITGNQANSSNAKFLPFVKPGDFLSIECINIEKKGVTSLSTSFWVSVIK